MEILFNLTAGWGTMGALHIRLVVAVLLVFMVIPLQVKEALVKNGLISLRRQMLIGGVTILISNLIVVITLADLVLHKSYVSPSSEFLQVFNALAFLILSVTYVKIYRQQFSRKQKHIHKLANDIEKKEKR